MFEAMTPTRLFCGILVLISVSSGFPIKDSLKIEYEADINRKMRVKHLPALVALGAALATTPPGNPVMPFAKTTLDPPEMDNFHRMTMAALHAPPPMYNDLDGPRRPMNIHNNPIGLNTFAMPPDSTLISSPGPIPSVLLVKDLFQRVLFPNGVPLPKSWTEPKDLQKPSNRMKLFLAQQLNAHVKKEDPVNTEKPTQPLDQDKPALSQQPVGEAKQEGSLQSAPQPLPEGKTQERPQLEPQPLAK